MIADSILAELEQLYRSKELPDSEKPFINDGIINPDLFAKQQNRVLFIAKEHNLLADRIYPANEDNYMYWWNLHVHLQFSHRISEWAYGIQNDFMKLPEKLTYNEKHEALKSIAFINVKKSSGGASANSDVIFKYIRESKNLLLRQILEISPTHIITCFRYDHYPNELFDMELTRTESNTFGYGWWNGIKIINFYHPSSRKDKTVLYGQLKEAVRHVDSV